MIDDYYMPLVEIKDFNALIDNKSLVDQPVKNKQEVYEKLIEMWRNYDYTIGNVLDYLYHQKYYKSIGIDLSWQTNTSIPQKINFVGKLGEDDGVTMFVIAEKQQKTILNVSLDSSIVNDPKLVKRKWNIVNYYSKANYGEENDITYNTEVLKSNLCDYNHAYIWWNNNWWCWKFRFSHANVKSQRV